MALKNALSFIMFNIIWIVMIFFMAVIIFLTLRIFVCFSIGGDFLFSFEDIKRAGRISIFAGPICGSGSWFIYYRHYNLQKK